MFDIFYSGVKPGLFEHEREADSIEHARQLSGTRYFWWVNYLSDYSNWDWLYEPVPWQSDQMHVWPSQHHEYSGTWLVPKTPTDKINFHSQTLPNRASRQHWHILHPIHEDQWDWSWAPHPLDPPYIYVFGNQWWPGEIMPTLEYRVPGATERKYMDMPATLLPNNSHWLIPTSIDPASVDLSWVPHPCDPPFIYEFATQWQPNGGARYLVPGATEIKYVDIQHRSLADKTLWHVPELVDPVSVDYSWHPDRTEQPYIYEFATQWQPNGGARYLVPGATEIKYVDIQHRRLPDQTHWQTPALVDPASVDYSWHPDCTEQPYIYEFATQWQPNGGARYHVNGATEIKYVDIQHRRLPDKQSWKLLEAVAEFDYSWHPDNTAEPYNYVFGNQHWPGTEMPTAVYCVPGAGQEKFVEHPVARLWACMGNWEFCEDIDLGEWDWSWVPNPKDPPYIYVFGNQWNPPEFKASLRYHVEGATEVKYMDRRTRRLPQPDLFKHNLPVAQFDYSWEPNPFDPPYIYVFGNQWNPAVLEPTVSYHVHGASEIKYVEDIVAKVAPDVVAFELLDDIEEFDYSWRPNPTDPPYVYVFGNQWLAPEQRPALRYRVGAATEIKYMDHPKARRRGSPEKFSVHHHCDFDWSWEPDPGSPPYIYVFGNQWHPAEIMPTVEYVVPGATERKYMDAPLAQLAPRHDNHWHTLIDCDWDYSWRPNPGDPPYIYVFGNQWHPAEVMPTVEYHVPGATERKYMDAPVGQLLVDMTLWHVPENINVTDMDFSWVPDPGSPPYIYQFATQHQKTGGPQYRMPGATEIKYVDMMRAEVTAEAIPVVEIDHLDGNAGLITGAFKRIRYFDNYRDTLIRLAKSLQGTHEHVWVCSSICDYTNFDFSWHPEKWQSTMLHVFASDNQKFGDTFYMHVPTFADRAEKKKLLEWYAVNYVPRISVPRRPMPVINHNDDSHVDAVKTQDFAGPLATFTNHDYVPGNLVTVPLWRQEAKTIVPVSSGAGTVVVPRVAVPFIKTQLYDYPHIDKTQRVLKDSPLDIVFIANGEINAERHFGHLNSVTYNLENRLHRVDNVKGRVAAYHAAAEASQTPWFFAVFAKLEVDKNFDWSWQPDRMQQPKHYIFHARNPVNGLEYGHQAMIAYNRKLVLANQGQGLDFTLDQPHEVVPILSGTAYYANSQWMAWRTAFREVIKLKASLPDVESEYRLNRWLSSGVKDGVSPYSQYGAEDAVQYYDLVNGDFAELRKSYEWEWLASYAFMRRKLTPDR